MPALTPQCPHNGITIRRLEKLTNLDGLILAVPYAQYLDDGPGRIAERLKPGGVLIDVKSVLPPDSVPPGVRYWSR